MGEGCTLSDLLRTTNCYKRTKLLQNFTIVCHDEGPSVNIGGNLKSILQVLRMVVAIIEKRYKESYC